MMIRFLLIIFSLSAVATMHVQLTQAQPKQAQSIVWRDWSLALFDDAARTKSLVLLDLEAVWCHWCHVMDKTTYQDPRVVALLARHCIAVKVDQDARPDLSLRYEDYGWPATIIFDASGRELEKISGYIPPDEMVSLLERLIANPTPMAESNVARKPYSVASAYSLPAPLLEELQQKHFRRYDQKHGGWGTIHKFLQGDNLEYSMMLAQSGNKRAERMARQTLNLQLSLFDKVWGGVYQYSHGGVWSNPHFEKIMSVQAVNMRIYALAFLQWKDVKYLRAAESIVQYLRTFLKSPNGAFYASQDADVVQGKHSDEYFALNDTKRRKIGVPRIDTHIYSRENGWIIEALCVLATAARNKQYLVEAEKAAEWIEGHRRLPDGSFQHGEADTLSSLSWSYLGDNIAMAKAYLALYEGTAKRKYLDRAEQTAQCIGRIFLQRQGTDTLAGFMSAVQSNNMQFTPAIHRTPTIHRDENIDVARFANILFFYTAKASYRRMAEIAMHYLVSPDVAEEGRPSGVLLADAELRSEPAHITIVGAKNNPAAQQLFTDALTYPSGFRRVEWWDNNEGKLPNQDIEYPILDFPAAFVCAKGRCSLPITNSDAMAKVMKNFHKK